MSFKVNFKSKRIARLHSSRQRSKGLLKLFEELLSRYFNKKVRRRNILQEKNFVEYVIYGVKKRSEICIIEYFLHSLNVS